VSLKKSVSVYQDKVRDRWVVDFYDHQGKRKRKFRSTEAEAIKLKRETEKSLGFEADLIERGMVIVDEKKNRKGENKILEIEIRDAIKKHRELSKSHLTPESYTNEKYYFQEFYGWCVEDRVQNNPKTGKPYPESEPIIYVDQLTTLHVAEFQSWLISRNNSSSTVNRKFNTLKTFFANCKTWGFTGSNLAEGIKAKKITKKIGRKNWTKEQIIAVLIELGVEASDVCLFLAATGCRPSQGFYGNMVTSGLGKTYGKNAIDQGWCNN
jgi:hypothetical protein